MERKLTGAIAPRAIENDGAVAAQTGLSPASHLGFDAARYWSYLEGIEASDAQKAALLDTLWTIMSRFVEIGFGVDPVQTVIPALIRAAIEEEEAEETAARYDFETVAGSRYKEKENEDDRYGQHERGDLLPRVRHQAKDPRRRAQLARVALP